MYDQEKITPYGEESEKAAQVEQMFDDIAPTYDTLNHRLSWNIDKGWRRKAIKELVPHQPQTMLDIATGTGDFAILAAQMLKPRKLIGADISEGMMEIGKQKVKKAHLEDIISFEKQDCLELSYPDESFDAVMSNYVYHNIPSKDRQAILLETLRVLKKGGCFAIHDIMSQSKYGNMQSFVEKLKGMGYENVELIETTDGKFMSPFEAKWMALSGSAILVGRK